MMEPADGSWAMTVDKFFRRNSENTQAQFDIRAAMAVFQIPNVTPQMMQWIELAFRLAEETTNIPLVTQGQSGKNTPDTFGGQQLQDSNAMQLLRDVGYSVAENITNPLVRDMYEWLLLDPDTPEDEKGDLQVDANASIAMIEKALQDQAILMLHPLVGDPGFGFDKRKYAQTWVRIKRLNPSDIMLSDEDFERQMSQPPPPPPQVMAAQIRAESAAQIAQSRDQLTAVKIKTDTDRDTEFNRVLAQREEITRELGIKKLELEVRLAELKYLEARQGKLDDKKTDLAITTMELRAQEALAGPDGKGPQVREPKIEPEGRASEGRAFQE
jgi:hypothetical protein